MALTDVTYQVVNVIPGDPVKVDLQSGPTGETIPNVPVQQGIVGIQRGDNVALGAAGGVLWVAMCFTPGRRYVDPFTVTLQGSAPAGMDQVSAWYAQAGKTKQPNLVGVYAAAPVVPPSGSAGATIYIPAVSSGTYRATFGGQWMGDPGVYQGVYSGYGQHIGSWFYGATAFTTPLTSVTPKSGSVYIRRKTGSGDYAAVPVWLYLHNHATQPGGAPTLGDGPITPVSLSVGAEAEVPIPPAWLSALKSGAAKGFSVTTDSTADYAQFSGVGELDIAGRVTITY